MVIILKDKNDYKSCVIYKGDCSCGSRYIGETKRNVEVRWNEHNQLKAQNHQNTFEATSTTILHGLRNIKTRENLETSYIALWKLDRNEQKYFERLVLFGNDVT